MAFESIAAQLGQIGQASSSNWLSSGLFGSGKTAGLFGTGGKFDLGQSMMTAGMGLGLAQSFGSS
ncbi:MAG: hypothetical protein ACXADY_23770, partial [Candidatus Hodarchaeales archaeon]